MSQDVDIRVSVNDISEVIDQQAPRAKIYVGVTTFRLLASEVLGCPYPIQICLVPLRAPAVRNLRDVPRHGLMVPAPVAAMDTEARQKVENQTKYFSECGSYKFAGTCSPDQSELS